MGGQHNKGLLIMSSPRTHSERARHGGFLTLDAEHRTDFRRPLDQPHSTTTETDEDGDGLTLGTCEVAAPLQLTTPHSDEDRGRRRRRETKTYSL